MKAGMRGSLIALVAFTLTAMLTGCGESGGGAQGGDYPGGKPVTMVAPAEPGSGWDTTARALDQVFQEEQLIDNPMPIENQVGATGSVWLSQMVNNQKGKDDVLAVTSLPIMSNNLRGDSKYSYKDITMVSRIITEYYMVVVPKDSPYKDLDDLLAAEKKGPGAIPVGASGDDRLPFALLVDAANGDPQKINFVSYEGGGEQITALLNGDIKAAVAGVSEFRGQLESGDLRGLAVLKSERLTGSLGDIPTAKELGYNVELENWRGIYGPPDMPDYAVKYWQDTLKKTLKTPTWKDVAKKNQWDTTYMDGKELQNYLKKTNASIKKGLEQTGEIE